VNVLNKEEILKRSRHENFDEREKHIDDESYSYGIVGVLGLSVLLMIWNMAHGYPYSDMTTIILGYITSSSLFKYKKNKTKRLLIASILGIFATVCSLITYFLFGV
jgi:hypothetical protein